MSTSFRDSTSCSRTPCTPGDQHRRISLHASHPRTLLRRPHRPPPHPTHHRLRYPTAHLLRALQPPRVPPTSPFRDPHPHRQGGRGRECSACTWWSTSPVAAMTAVQMQSARLSSFFCSVYSVESAGLFTRPRKEGNPKSHTRNTRRAKDSYRLCEGGLFSKRERVCVCVCVYVICIRATSALGGINGALLAGTFLHSSAHSIGSSTSISSMLAFFIAVNTLTLEHTHTLSLSLSISRVLLWDSTHRPSVHSLRYAMMLWQVDLDVIRRQCCRNGGLVDREIRRSL
jgi:hypothetical protein